MVPNSPLQEVYIQLIEIQKTLMEHQRDTHEELNNIKKALNDRLAPLEQKTAKHESIFYTCGKVVTWAIPSSSIVAVLAWVFGIFGHKPY